MTLAAASAFVSLSEFLPRCPAAVEAARSSGATLCKAPARGLLGFRRQKDIRTPGSRRPPWRDSPPRQPPSLPEREDEGALPEPRSTGSHLLACPKFLPLPKLPLCHTLPGAGVRCSPGRRQQQRGLAACAQHLLLLASFLPVSRTPSHSW